MIDSTTNKQTFKELEVLIVANFVATDGTGNCRFGELARRLADLGASVELVTSDFEHDNHTRRINPTVPENYRLTMLHETGYRSNVSVKRLMSQHVFARSVAKYLRTRATVPDVVYCASPSPAAAKACAQYAQRHRKAFVVDIQDLWPEAFGMSLPVPLTINLLFQPMIRASRIAYRQADLVVGVSGTYIAHAERTAGRPIPASVVFLGTSLAVQDQTALHPAPDRAFKPVNIGYAGTLSHSYDIPLVIDAMRRLSQENDRFSTLELTVLGDGPKRQEFEHYAQQSGVRVRFLGRLAYPDMVRELRSCGIAVNPIVAGSMGSILNKAGDYAAAGLPVINTQESPEYRDLLDSYEAGRNCANGSVADVAEGIRELVDDPALRARLGQNSRRMAEDLFDRDTTYDALARKLLTFAQENAEANTTGRR